MNAIRKFLSRLSVVAAVWMYGASVPAYSLDVPTVPINDPISIADKNINATIQFARFHSAMDASEEVVELKRGIFCLGDKVLRYDAVAQKNVYNNLRVFIPIALTKAGYPKFGGSDSTFESNPLQAADFQLGATLLDFKSIECVSESNRKGAYYLKVKWELFSPRLQKVVYTKIIEGSNKADSFIGKFDYIELPYIHLVNNLLADPDFVATIASANQAAATDKSASTFTAEQPLLGINGVRPPAGGVQKNAGALRNAVVTVRSNNSMGTAFFISRDGYLLTDQHVVANARFVKIRLLNKQELIGEVLRSNAARDIALIKTPAVDIDPIAIRASEANIGEEVYAIGSPLSESLAGTITRGILSGMRSFDGRDYLQSDVSVNHGNSGGPLLDASGAALGLTERFYDASVKSGLNLFTPISDALKKLNVEVVN